jgi:hypothetical protein
MHHVVLLVALALLLGCQQGSAPRVDDAAPLSPALRLKAEADALMRAGRHVAAAERYREAVVLEPDRIALRFALATAYTFLPRRQEAIDQFRWIVRRADPATVEHKESRRWLAAAGVPIDPPARPTDPDGEERLIGGRLTGRAEWPGIDPKVRAVSGEISIRGVEGVTETVKRSRPLRLGGSYHFWDIPAGRYQIIARMYGHPEDVTLWDQTVMVHEGRPTELVLTPATARLSPGEFPPPVAE